MCMTALANNRLLKNIAPLCESNMRQALYVFHSHRPIGIRLLHAECMCSMVCIILQESLWRPSVQFPPTLCLFDSVLTSLADFLLFLFSSIFLCLCPSSFFFQLYPTGSFSCFFVLFIYFPISCFLFLVLCQHKSFFSNLQGSFPRNWHYLKCTVT